MPAAPRRLPSAVADIIAAAEWYDDQREGLGDDFVAEVDEAIRSLAQTALLYGVRYADVRCARLKRFKPYGIFYYLWQEEIIVFSVFHASRRPQIVRSRRIKLGGLPSKRKPS